MAKIILENMEFYAYHGCMEHENTLGNTFLVTVSVDLNTGLAGKTDKLEDALNYQLIYDVVAAEMNKRSRLIEHVTSRILDKIMDEFPVITSSTVRLTKKNPPLGAKVESVTIQLEKSR